MLKKEIIIKNKKDLNKFYKKIKYYKYLFFVYFETDNKEINHIINVLNIKNRNKRIEYIYDYACNYIDNYWNGKNYCGFKSNKCYCQYDSKNINGCCRLCLNQSNTGCTTSNLTCKFYYCTEVLKRHKVLTINDLNILRLYSFRQRIIIKHSYFNKKKEILFDLKYSTLVIFAIRLIYKNIKRMISIKKYNVR